MRRCWDKQPDVRPDFRTIVNEISDYTRSIESVEVTAVKTTPYFSLISDSELNDISRDLDASETEGVTAE